MTERVAESYGWPLVAIAAIVLPQVLIPSRDRIGPPLLVPLVEGCVFIAIAAIAARPGPVPRGARPLVLTLVAVLAGANAAAAGHLVLLVLHNGTVDGVPLTADRLLVAGALVVLANVVTFGLLYWQLDGGGPAGRVAAHAPARDFQFPQMADAAGPGWQPTFADHLYVAFTNVLAFSPTDSMPLTHRAKGLMALQSAIAVSVMGVVLARVINTLPG